MVSLFSKMVVVFLLVVLGLVLARVWLSEVEEGEAVDNRSAPPTGAAVGVFDEPKVVTWFAQFMGMR